MPAPEIQTPEFRTALEARRARVDHDAEAQHIERLLNLQQDIDNIEAAIFMAERSDNHYYTSGRAQRHKADLRELKRAFEQAQNDFASAKRGQ